jgi:hypothetical protein
MEGVMAGHSMLSFIDLDKSATDRSPTLLGWVQVQSWCGKRDITPLTPEEWFQEGHGITSGHLDKHGVWMPDHEPSGKIHLWASPPAVADAMLEELLKVRHKRTDTFHVVLIPCLMSPQWRRLFHKAVDISFVVDAGCWCFGWPSNMFEPLLWAFSSLSPVTGPGASNAPLIVEVGRELCQVFKEGDVIGRRILRKLFKLSRKLDTVSTSVALGLFHIW